MKLIKGQIVKRGELVGRVKRMFGEHKVQVVTTRERLLMEGFPARPCGTALCKSTETWSVDGLEIEA